MKVLTNLMIFKSKCFRPSYYRSLSLSSSAHITSEMNKFYSAVNMKENNWKLDHSSNILFIGSCFSENISKELENMKFKVTANPHGIIFNPISISNCLTDVLSAKVYNEKDIFIDAITSEVYHSWYHHSAFSCQTQTEMLGLINSQINAAHRSLFSADALFITLGTAFAYELIESGMIVANCHMRKRFKCWISIIINNMIFSLYIESPKLFRKRLLSIDEITSSLRPAIQKCLELNKNLKVTF